MGKVSQQILLPLVSVIIPSGDSHATIKAAIESVLGQSYPSLEIIVVLNGETGITSEIIKEYHDVKTLTLPTANVYEARRYGASRSHGKYILFLDADDYLHRDTISTAVKAAEYNRADIVQLKLVQFASKSGLYLRWKFPCRYDTEMALKGILSDPTIYNPAMIAKLYKRDLIIPFPDISYQGFWGEDRLFNMHIYARKPVTAYAPSAIYNYRFGGMSRDMSREGLADEMAEVHTLKLDFLQANDLQSYISDVEKEYAYLQEILRKYNPPKGFLRIKLLIAKFLS